MNAMDCIAHTAVYAPVNENYAETGRRSRITDNNFPAIRPFSLLTSGEVGASGIAGKLEPVMDHYWKE
jgi:hypothetical protein